MVKSMTGFGQSKLDSEDINLGVEVKTLNSKFLDSIIKLPREFSDKELDVKNILTDRLIRGKVSVAITFLRKDVSAVKMDINRKLFNEYYQNLLAVAKEAKAPEQDVFKLAIQMPEVVLQRDAEEDLSEDWNVLLKHIHTAIDQCDDFRVKEGGGLQKKLLSYIENIGAFLTSIDEQDPQRIQAVRERLNQKITELQHVEKIDNNRFEQELIYYIEKLDINEEKVRLKSHLDYFVEVMNNPVSQGKKLGFISQEIGREINTIGSKANDAVIQRFVVGMKEELEKIKEQLLNIL
ncbi:YicC/YloC family endoribonuclease [Fulvivirgaceae bacterium BMA12]|uniref:YicC/YloC family endoribonuclease n=1 Tax=Agaribacillus aureus TaxID=3051825 RepID=A0ABT8LDE1_9BACT|nr:YicC/YloC family endoribonuclease [Fulvivirgaceae bacterium BMA12]